MKKIYAKILLAIALGFSTIAYGQYQLPNGGFETWSDGVPTGFHSFESTTGSLASFAGGIAPEKLTDIRPGSSGSYSVRIKSTSKLGVIANGNLTTGQIVANSATASSSDNHNQSVPGSSYCQTFIGKPDSMIIWAKYVPASSSYSDNKARVNTVLHTNATYKDPEGSTDYSNIKCAHATVEYAPAADNGWQRLSVPFVYDNTSISPAYILISATTNRTAGGGTSGDMVTLDDFSFVYNSRLSSLKVGGTTIAGFSKDKYNYTVEVASLSSLPAVTATTDSKYATMETKTSGNTTTITVKGNDYASSGNAHTYTVNFKVTSTITASDVTTTYGTTADLQVSSTNSESALEYSFADNSIAKVENGKIVPLKAGKTTLTVNQAESATYLAASKTINITVENAVLTASVKNIARKYGEKNPSFAISYSGFVNGETSSVVTTKAKASTTATTTSDIGQYPITLSGAVAANYTINYSEGTLTIEKATLTVTANSSARKYGEANPDLSLSYSGFANNESEAVLTTAPVATTVASVTSEVGSYDITLSGGVATNYDFVYISGTLTIGKAILTVTADNKSRAYGEENPTLTLSYSGFVNDESESALTVLPSASCEATAGSAAGVYTITVQGGEAANYEFNYVNGTLTIGASEAKMSIAEIGAKTYGEAPFALHVSSTNTESPITYSIKDESVATIDGGIVTILKAGRTEITASQAASTNFGETSATVSLIVEKAALTLNIDNATRKYGEENPTLTASFSGWVGNDNAGTIALPTLSCKAGVTDVPGNYDITATAPVDDRYAISVNPGVLSIEKAVITVTTRNESTEVGAEPTTDYEIRYKGFVNGEDVSVLDVQPTASCEVTQESPIGSYPIVVSGGEDNCYSFIYEGGTYTVRSANQGKTNITLAAISDKMYGDLPFAPSYTTNNGDVAVELEFSDPTIAEYANGQIHILRAGTTTVRAYQDESANFAYGESNEITLTVEKAPLRVSVDNAFRGEGEINPEFVLVYSGFLNGDDASVIDIAPVATTDATLSSPAGYYDITVSGGEDDCYTFTQYIGGTLVVTEPLAIDGTSIEGARIYVAGKRLVVEGINASIVEIYDLSGRRVATFAPGDMVTLPTRFYIARANDHKACIQVR